MELKLFARREFASFDFLRELGNFVWRIRIRMDMDSEKDEMMKGFLKILLRDRDVENHETIVSILEENIIHFNIEEENNVIIEIFGIFDNEKEILEKIVSFLEIISKAQELITEIIINETYEFDEKNKNELKEITEKIKKLHRLGFEIRLEMD